MNDRKYPMAKKFKAVTLDSGVTLILPVVEDLDDEYIKLHFEKALEDEDYEYCEVLSAEAKMRDLVLNY